MYDYLRRHSHSTRADISTALGLSIPTVSKYLTHLIETGLAEQKTKLRPGEDGGRAPAAYASVPDARIALGVSVTKRHITAVATNLNGDTVHSVRVRHPYSRTDEHARYVGKLCSDLVATCDIDPAHLLGIGIAMPGLVDRASNAVVYGRVIDNEGMTSAHFQRFLDAKATILHDSYAAGLAESWRWDHLNNAFYITLSGSVGGAVIFNNEIFTVNGGYPGEIGHLLLVPNGTRCYCGRYGCMDTVCNTSVLIGDTEDSIEQFFAELSTNLRFQSRWQSYTDHLARAIHSVRALFGGTIILGGEVGTFIGDHLGDVLSKVDQLALFGERAHDYVVPARQKNNSVATGAALSHIQKFLKDPGP